MNADELTMIALIYENAKREIAALSSIANNYNATTSSSVNTMHIGKIDISTQATDATGIAAGIQPALAKHGFAQFANTGPM